MTIDAAPRDFDIAIIGCGPVGALAANLLGRAGLSTVVLEQEHMLHPLPRAVHLDHEMMRLFQSAGVIDRLDREMRDTDGHLHVGSDYAVIRYMGTVGKPRPYGWSNDYFFYQPELEASLRAGFADDPHVELRLGAVFTGLSQSDDGVRIDYLWNDAPQNLTVRWVIACDGARSLVRRALGIALDDLDFEEPWLVVDAEVDGEIQFPPIAAVPVDANLQNLSVMMCDPRRPTTIVPGRGNHRRWEFMLLPGEDDEAMMATDKVDELVGAWLAGTSHRIVRAATYRFHGLVARQWQVSKVFLAGDAAHQTPPFFGQGMCHGMRDVANIIWKMAAVVHDGADPAVLDSYQRERDPHVRAIIGAAVAAGRYICELDRGLAAERDARVREESRSKGNETAADLVPPIRDGLILAETPGAGARFVQPRLADGRKLDDLTGASWRLFVRDDKIHGFCSGVSRFVASHLSDGGAVLGWLDANGADAVLIRPDHYVFGTAAGSADALLKKRARALGLRMENDA